MAELRPEASLSRAEQFIALIGADVVAIPRHIRRVDDALHRGPDGLERMAIMGHRVEHCWTFGAIPVQNLYKYLHERKLTPHSLLSSSWNPAPLMSRTSGQWCGSAQFRI